MLLNLFRRETILIRTQLGWIEEVSIVKVANMFGGNAGSFLLNMFQKIYVCVVTIFVYRVIVKLTGSTQELRRYSFTTSFPNEKQLHIQNYSSKNRGSPKNVTKLEF